MKIHQIFKANGRELPIVSIALVLDRDAPGRGIVAVQSPEPLAGDVQIFAGINGKAALYFAGYIEQCVRIDAKQQRLVIRTATGKLAGRAPIARRNSKLAEIIGELQRLSGVAFRTAGDWPQRPIPHFVNLGSGREALRLIGQLSGVPDWIALEQPDGALYLGSAVKVKRRRQVLRFDAKVFTNLSATGADCAFMPALRPGMIIRIGDSAAQEITTVNMTAETLRLGLEYA